MRTLHHPGTPCNNQDFKDLEEIISEDNFEAVRGSNGFGVFGINGEYWVSTDELKKLSSSGNINVFDSLKVPKSNSWIFSAPVDLTIELTRDCNQRYIHCWNESGEGLDIDYTRVKDLVREFRDYGGQIIKLVGGEPTVYPNFINLIAFLKKVKVPRLEITTNGTHIKEEEIESLRDIKTHVNLSLHGGDYKTHEIVSQFPGSYERAIKTLESLKANGIDTTLYFTLMQINKSSISDLMEIAQRTNSSVKFNFLQSQGRAKNLIPLCQEELYDSSKIIIEEANKRGVRLERSGLVPCTYKGGIDSARFYGCSGMRKSMYISSTGDVFPCELFDVSLGNIYKKNIAEIWRGKKADSFRKFLYCDSKNSCSVDCSGKCKAPFKEEYITPSKS